MFAPPAYRSAQQSLEIGPPCPLPGDAVFAQDVLNSTLLSELVYRSCDCPDEDSFARAQAVVEGELGTQLRAVRRHKSGGQRFLVGETESAVYVAFQGTKSATDWLANLNFFHWSFSHGGSGGGAPPAASAAGDASFSSAASTTSSSSSGSSGSFSSSSGRARAHVGFLRRANQSAVSITALLPKAVLTGPAALAALHILGSAAYQAALPVTHPLGQQWVMTAGGMEWQARPLDSYPRDRDQLGLAELGGFCPGHRMIAYRRRVTRLSSGFDGRLGSSSLGSGGGGGGLGAAK